MAGTITNSDASENFDAELANTAIAEGEEKATEVNVEADYEASKAFSVSEIDRTEAGAQAAAAATASQRSVPQATETKTVAQSTSDPSDYKDMAAEVSSAPAGTTEVNDSLVEKAIQKGQAGGSEG